MPDYINELNEHQQKAVLYCDGPSLIIAGAGSGKTRVLTYKIAHLLQNGYMPWNILALTFTNKAAREMKERIAQKVDPFLASQLWMGTFHSVFLKILHRESDALGFSHHFSIYDTADSKSLIRSILKEMQLDEKDYKPSLVMHRISSAKNNLLSPQDYGNNPEQYKADSVMRVPKIREIYATYMQRCKQSDVMDFDDLLLYTYILFRDNPDILEKYSEQFSYILVDEYQDTNTAQHSIVKLLGQKHRRVCVVGDDAQSIYSFRGADISNILYFTKIFEDAKLFKLEQNYRSTQTIVNAANSLINKNERQIRKEVFSENEIGERLTVFQAYSDVDEAEFVAGKILYLHNREEQCDYKDIAVLYRTNAQSRVIEDALRKRGIPYRIYGGLSFYQRKEIKDVLAYLRLATNPDDEEAFKRVVNYPARGIGNTTLSKLYSAAVAHNVSLWKVVNAPENYEVNLNSGTLNKLGSFVSLIHSFMEDVATLPAVEAGTRIIRGTGIIAELSKESPTDFEAKKDNIEELINALESYSSSQKEEENRVVNLVDFLSEVVLLTDQDIEDENSEQDMDKVTLMTIHAAKGLEFRNVFVVGLEENLFPGARAIESMKEMEEERRLFYVAITRAEKRCFLTLAKSRMKYGRFEMCLPSRFLYDIDYCYVDMPTALKQSTRIAHQGMQFRDNNDMSKYSQKPELKNSKQTVTSQKLVKVQTTSHSNAGTNKMQDDFYGVSVGDRVAHVRFGEGKIIKLEGEKENAKATIKFDNVGEKNLLLRFARLTKLEK